MPKEKESVFICSDECLRSQLAWRHIMKRMETWHRDLEEMQRENLETMSHRAGWKVRNFTRAVTNVEDINHSNNDL